MNIWPANTIKPISIVADSKAMVIAYVKERTTNKLFSMINISFTYKGDSVWELLTEFDAGEYMIKVTVNDTPTYTELLVVPVQQYDYTINQQIIKNKLGEVIDLISSNTINDDDHTEIIETLNIINARL